MIAEPSTFHLAPLTAEHVRATAKLHRVAFHEWMSSKLGDGYTEALMDYFARTPECFGFVALNKDQQVLGYAMGAPVGYTEKSMKALFRPALWGLVTHPWVLLSRDCRRTLRSRLKLLRAKNKGPQNATSSLPTPTMSLVGIGVAPTAQRQGIGQALLAEFERESRSRGMKSMRLIVRRGNAAASKLYERAGWHECAESTGVSFTQFFGKVLS